MKGKRRVNEQKIKMEGKGKDKKQRKGQEKEMKRK